MRNFSWCNPYKFIAMKKQILFLAVAILALCSCKPRPGYQSSAAGGEELVQSETIPSLVTHETEEELIDSVFVENLSKVSD